MADDFARAVEDGLKLSKRIYFGKDRSISPPKRVVMDKTPDSYMPSAPMAYAVISDPRIVDNPDITSYQPHVHGCCDPPALIPLHMSKIALEVETYLDTAFVSMIGSWRVHCVMRSRSCDCRIAVPITEQGSILGVEVEIPGKSYSTQMIAAEDKNNAEIISKSKDDCFVKHQIFTLKLPQVDGGSHLSVKVSWSQKLLFRESYFSIFIPFSFPHYVTPAGKKISKRERIQLTINSCAGTEILCRESSHLLKELKRHSGGLNYLYDSEVVTWSNSDFMFSYTISTSRIFGGVLLQSPSVLDVDQHGIFCLYLFPNNSQAKKAFKREIVFVVDISGSMRGNPLDSTKNALCACLSKLHVEDSFNIIAFNEKSYLFSSSMALATPDAIEKAIHWMGMNFVAGGGTNILIPLNKSMELLSKRRDSIPTIFLVTDGTVEDERHIDKIMRSHLQNQECICPRIYTFGIGSFCNHYFLQMLASIGRGQHDAVHDDDLIESRMESLISKALSTVLADITSDDLQDFGKVELFPSCIPDLSSESPLMVSGRYHGVFPSEIKVRGLLADLSSCSIELKVNKASDMPVEKICASQQIGLLTAKAWLSEDEGLKERVSRMSMRTCVPSEFTRMVLLETGAHAQEKAGKPSSSNRGNNDGQRRTVSCHYLCVGFGDLTATAENILPGCDRYKALPPPGEVFVKAASNCCGRMCDYCCCACCIKCCSQMNDQCVIVFTQLCAALSFLGCAICCSGDDA